MSKPEGVLNINEENVVIEFDHIKLRGTLGLPEIAKGLVMFAHGSGSGRLSPRNAFVAHKLQEGGLATLLIDLLQEVEEDDRQKVFDIDLLTNRLVAATHWLKQHKKTTHLPIGLFGASTGAAAALQAAARDPSSFYAVVSRGGRPDLAMDNLHDVKAPTQLIVGGNDVGVIDLNEQALENLVCTKELKIVPGATHLFEEPGKLEEVAALALEWFQKHVP